MSVQIPIHSYLPLLLCLLYVLLVKQVSFVLFHNL